MNFKEMSKDDMEAYAKEHFGIDIDRRQKISSLRTQLEELQKSQGTPDDATAEILEAVATRDFVRNKKTGGIFDTTPTLAKRVEDGEFEYCAAPVRK